MWSLDHTGPLAQTVTDAAFMLQDCGDCDLLDPASANMPVPDLPQKLGQDITGMRVGLLRSIYEDNCDPKLLGPYHQGIRQFERLGAEIVDVPSAGLGPVNTHAHDSGLLAVGTARKLQTTGARPLSRCRAALSASPLAPCSPPSGRSPRRAAQGAGCRPALAPGTPSPPGCPAGRKPACSTGSSSVCNENRSCGSSGRPGR